MRALVSIDGIGWLDRLDYKKLIIIVFLLRVIIASGYDIAVSVSGQDILLPDGKFYSIQGRYVDLILQGYDKSSATRDLLPDDKNSREIFVSVAESYGYKLPKLNNETNIFAYIVGFLYFVFGYSTIWVRIFNICISMLSVFFLFKVAQKHFGNLAANLFLIIALFLPAQFGYSITLSRDFLRVFIISLLIWVIYG